MNFGMRLGGVYDVTRDGVLIGLGIASPAGTVTFETIETPAQYHLGLQVPPPPVPDKTRDGEEH